LSRRKSGSKQLYTVSFIFRRGIKNASFKQPSDYPFAQIDSIGKWISYGALNETCGEVCDTINPVTFSGTIWPIMQTSSPDAIPEHLRRGIVLAPMPMSSTIAANGILLILSLEAGVPKNASWWCIVYLQIREFEIWVNSGSFKQLDIHSA